MKELRNDFKINQFKPVYLLYGEENYLIRHYAKQFTEQLLEDSMMNCDTFEGNEFGIDSVIDAANTLPFLSERRLVYVKDSQLLVAGRKNDSETLAKYLPSLPESTIMIFVESARPGAASIDKRNRLYKQIAAQGRVVECKIPGEAELIRWLSNIFKKKGKEISPQTARLILETVPKGMDMIYAEADKLGDFVGERKEILPEDIKAVCTKSLESRIFDLVRHLCMGQTEKALVQYHNMLSAKEQPLMILAMIARQFRMILQCKACEEKRLAQSEIAAALNLRDFIVSECLKQGKNFTSGRLLSALSDCQNTDVRIKTGLMEAELGVELLIVRYSI